MPSDENLPKSAPEALISDVFLSYRSRFKPLKLYFKAELALYSVVLLLFARSLNLMGVARSKKASKFELLACYKILLPI